MAGIDEVRDWIDEAEQVAVLTGAGISTDSGIPDFRGPAAGELAGMWASGCDRSTSPILVPSASSWRPTSSSSPTRASAAKRLASVLP